ncbi:M81 family metallopeptidase [Paraburkholderia strydomiana]|uniref:M81 family metallopeptidase n=1 Tax=Paraburkholderia strydomiana TaxID=1245417 RepID=UPI00285CC7DE|nr:M81 family metallopeptidase [Paraburkholderia strydomiana]MDR7009641.1 microcystin degradation protein MlrC [Paraburkholderia strydomiana]
MKVFVAGLLTETNSFVNLPTSIETFRQGHVRPGQGPTAAPIAGAELKWASQRRAAAGEFELVEGSCFRATPAGLTSRQAYEELRDEILGQLAAALPVDAVLLALHGGMIAFGYPDTEGDLIERVRQLVGEQCVIGVEFDPHCLITEKRLANSDVIVLYKEYPHTDIVEQADRLIDIVTGIVKRGLRPVASLYDCRQIDSYPTSAPHMRAFIDRVKSIEVSRSDQVISISVVHGFVYSDSPDLSTRILVYTNDAKPLGDELATTLGNELVAMRGKTAPSLLGIDAAIDAGLASAAFPVVIADPTDNAGGGAPSDNTEVLARLLARQTGKVAFGPVWDPVAVRLCFDAGIGATLPLRIGGKVAPTSGTPVDCVAEVIGLKRGAWQLFGDSRVECGDAAAIRIGEVEVALTTGRTQAFSLEAFTQVGIDPLAKQMVFVKSVNHFMAHFGPIAAEVLFVDGGGPLQRDYSAMRYQYVRRPIWPIDAEAAPLLLI